MLQETQRYTKNEIVADIAFDLLAMHKLSEPTLCFGDVFRQCSPLEYLRLVLILYPVSGIGASTAFIPIKGTGLKPELCISLGPRQQRGDEVIEF